jgi:hypothetical protein
LSFQREAAGFSDGAEDYRIVEAPVENPGSPEYWREKL